MMLPVSVSLTWVDSCPALVFPKARLQAIVLVAEPFQVPADGGRYSCGMRLAVAFLILLAALLAAAPWIPR